MGTSLDEAFLASLLNEIENSHERVILVLDDYHVVRSPRVHEAIELLIARLPPTMHLVLATRSEPPLPLARLRASGELNEIRSIDLQFSEDEAAGLAARDRRRRDRGNRCRSPAGTNRRVGCWDSASPVCHARPQGCPRAFIDQFAGNDRHVVDYLGSEVLEDLPRPLRRFLLRTSVLDQLSAPLCDAVTGEHNASDLLPELERSNAFVVPLDSRREWFRYHHLFAELLRHELARAEPDLIPALHRRARRLVSARTGASRKRSCTPPPRVRVLGPPRWSARVGATFSNGAASRRCPSWLDRLPEERVLGDPRLCLIRAWVAINVGQLDDLDLWVAAAERCSSNGAPGWSAERGRGRHRDASVHRALHVRRRGRRDRGSEARAGARGGTPSPWRTVGCPVLGLALFWSGAHDDARTTLEAAAVAAADADNRIAVIHARDASRRSTRSVVSGIELQQLCKQVQRLAEAQGLGEHWATAMAEATRARLEPRPDIAQAAAQHAVTVSRQGMARMETAYGLVTLAEIQSSGGAPADDVVRDARKTVCTCPDPGILAPMATRMTRYSSGGHEPSMVPSSELTGRELDVLRLLGVALTHREIARTLYVSANTVKTHTRNVYSKLGVSSRLQAVERARQLGLL